jgi:hypothetical protein
MDNNTPTIEDQIDAEAAKASGAPAPLTREQRLAAGENLDANVAPAVNLIGTTSEEEHGDQRTAVDELSTWDQAKRGFRGTFAYSGWNWAERHLMESDPSFNLDDHIESLKQSVPGQYWDRFEGTRSLAEAQQLKGEIISDLRDQNILMHSGAQGYAGYMLGGIVDLDAPITFLSGGSYLEAKVGLNAAKAGSSRPCCKHRSLRP